MHSAHVHPLRRGLPEISIIDDVVAYDEIGPRVGVEAYVPFPVAQPRCCRSGDDEHKEHWQNFALSE